MVLVIVLVLFICALHQSLKGVSARLFGIGYDIAIPFAYLRKRVLPLSSNKDGPSFCGPQGSQIGNSRQRFSNNENRYSRAQPGAPKTKKPSIRTVSVKREMTSQGIDLAGILNMRIHASTPRMQRTAGALRIEALNGSAPISRVSRMCDTQKIRAESRQNTE
jgi:hypothetical protein